MRIVRGFPPNIEELRPVFPVDKHTLFTYGDTIYTQEKEIPEDIIIHEEVHQKQQGQDPEWWWKRYINDPTFRKEQEAEAYAVQYRFVKKRVPNRIAKECLFELAQNLRSSLYGLKLSYQEAEQLIRKG